MLGRFRYHIAQLDHCGHRSSELPTAVMSRSAVVGAKVGSNGRLLAQAVAIPDTLRYYAGVGYEKIQPINLLRLLLDYLPY